MLGPVLVLARRLLLRRRRLNLRAGERPLKGFVSSVMSPELQRARETVVNTLGHVPFLTSWAFEYTPASSEPVDQGYLRHVREADVVVWLVGKDVTEPVQNEIRETMASSRRLLAFLLVDSSRQSPSTVSLIQEVGNYAKWTHVSDLADLSRVIQLTIGDELVRAMRDTPGMGRLARLEEVGRFSRARCIMRWQGAGVPRTLASELADEPIVGAPSPEILKGVSLSLMLLVGEAGAGKSLIGERLIRS